MSKTPQRPYRVRQDHGDGKITTRLVIATSQAQAIGHVSRKTFSAEAVSGLEAIKLGEEGIKPEYAAESAPTQVTL